MNHLIRSILLPAILALSSIAQASTDWYICTTDLQLWRVTSPRIESNSVFFLDGSGFESRRSIDDLFFIFPSLTPEPRELISSPGSGSPVWLTTTDLQRVRVLLSDNDKPNNKPDTLTISGMDNQTARSIDLELVRLLTATPKTLFNPAASQDDYILLNNGDEITGFIESIGNTVTIDTDTGTRSFPIEQTQLIQLANTTQPVPGTYLHLDSNTRLRAAQLHVSANEFGSAIITGLGSKDPVKIEPDRFGGIDIVHNHRQLVPLTNLPISTIQPTGDRSWTPTPTPTPTQNDTTTPIPNSGLIDLDLHAPVRIEYKLPPSTTRFACTAELVVGPWSDCTLIIEAGPTRSQMIVIQNIHLNAAQSTAIVLVDLPRGATVLSIRVEPGVNGPIQDHVILRQPRLLVESRSSQLE